MQLITSERSVGTRASIVAPDDSNGFSIFEDSSILTIIECAGKTGHGVVAARDVLPAKAAVASTFEINPYITRKWTDRDERRFDDLAFKKATFETSSAEDRELSQMIHARRRDIPGRTADEIMRTAEHDLLLKEMNEILTKYHVFTTKKRANH